jgi:hypothetical protein
MRLSRNDYSTLPHTTNGTGGSNSEPNSWNSKARKLPGKAQGSFDLASEPSKHLRSGELKVSLALGALRWIEGGIVAAIRQGFSFTLKP